MPKNQWRIYLLAFIGGVLGELTLMILGVLVGGMIGRWQGGAGFLDLALGILGALIGIALGAGLGVYLTWRRMGFRVSLWRAWVGSVLSVGGLIVLIEPLRLNQVGGVMWVLFLGLAPILAILLGRRGVF
ncbi:MAG: hypothetical protein ACPLUL_01025 [Thermanaerothrix sp.]|jgi:hypothetical protein|uniref:Major facilitator superfamily (MFS) profile domain-containing protein n=1 Tax=Thermanaerothrix solaris TaxID=3058434 RepID=A0ABU3NLT2_9CHLR|nr:hypothetical protein [Thermanaerothrix sp. 4228-RoL]MDT8897168.1 hypothetical protein [Thermanaerothrix sp. 4228-RoL]